MHDFSFLIKYVIPQGQNVNHRRVFSFKLFKLIWLFFLHVRTDHDGGKLIVLVTMILWTTVSNWLCNERVHALITAILLQTTGSEHDGTLQLSRKWIKNRVKKDSCYIFSSPCPCFLHDGLVILFCFGYEERSVKTRDDTGYLGTKKTQFWTHVWKRRSKNLTLTEHVYTNSPLQ